MKISKIAKNMMQTITVVVLVGMIGAFVYYRSQDALPFVWGALIGGASSFIRVMMLDRTINQVMNTAEKIQAQKNVAVQGILRFVISGIALFIGVYFDQVSLWGVVLGVFAYQIGAYRAASMKSNGE